MPSSIKITAITDRITSGLDEVSMLILAEAMRISSGDISKEELKNTYNSPYGLGPKTPSGKRRKKVHGGRLYIINMQSTNFLSNWRAEISGDSFTIYNAADYADDLDQGIPGLTKPRRFYDYLEQWTNDNVDVEQILVEHLEGDL